MFGFGNVSSDATVVKLLKTRIDTADLIYDITSNMVKAPSLTDADYKKLAAFNEAMYDSLNMYGGIQGGYDVKELAVKMNAKVLDWNITTAHEVIKDNQWLYDMVKGKCTEALGKVYA